jgi:uncharacterized protein
MLTRLSLAAIGGYQRHLSPRKGYACAYRIAHGGTGCSGFAKQAIHDAGLVAALPLIRARFAACRDAAKELREAPAARDKSRKQGCGSGCDCTGCSDIPCGHGHGCDLTPDDCTAAPDCCSP